MRHDDFLVSPHPVRIRSRGRLPHWEVDDAIYSVTFRLDDALPRAFIGRLKEERQALFAALDRRHMLTDDQRSFLDKLFGMRIDDYLDQGCGRSWFRRDELAEIVANALMHFDGSRYTLHAWCVMPNHVHVVFHLTRGRDLDRMLHSWKSYTAHEINRCLGREGPLWQREYHDRVVRTAVDYMHTIAYVLNNPYKAGLRNWKWMWSR